jgi:hypothetical protein
MTLQRQVLKYFTAKLPVYIPPFRLLYTQFSFSQLCDFKTNITLSLIITFKLLSHCDCDNIKLQNRLCKYPPKPI